MSRPVQPSHEADACWVKRAQHGDVAAFAELVRRHRMGVYAAAYVQLRDHGEAEDAAQEAFMTAHAKLDSIREPERFGVWVCKISARLAARRRTRSKREVDHLRDMTTQSPAREPITPWQALANGELQEAVRGLVQELSQVNREAIDLYYLRGYSIEQIAKFLDAPPGTVKRRLHDGRVRLRALLVEALDPEILNEFLPNGRNNHEA